MKYRFKNTNKFYFENNSIKEYGNFGKDGEVGPPGKSGPIGDPGPQGEKVKSDNIGIGGSMGDRGNRGSRGDRGPDGITGEKGDFYCQPGTSGRLGASGDKGPDGDKGDKGDKGNLGPKGIMGLKGFPGTGLIGPPGDQGESEAPKGFMGNPGLRGDMGDRGDKGEKGFMGQKGKKGKQGRMGFGLIPLMNLPPCQNATSEGDCIEGKGIELKNVLFDNCSPIESYPSEYPSYLHKNTDVSIVKECSGKDKCNFKIPEGERGDCSNDKVSIEYICNGNEENVFTAVPNDEHVFSLQCSDNRIPTLLTKTSDKCDFNIETPEKCREIYNNLKPSIDSNTETSGSYEKATDLNATKITGITNEDIEKAKQISLLAGLSPGGCSNLDSSYCDPFVGNWWYGGLYHYPNHSAWKGKSWFGVKPGNTSEYELNKSSIGAARRVTKIDGFLDNSADNNIKCYGSDVTEDTIKQECDNNPDCKGYTLRKLNSKNRNCRLIDYDYEYPGCQTSGSDSCMYHWSYTNSHQKKGKVYKVGNKCYYAKDYCNGCLSMGASSYPGSLEEVPCVKDSDCTFKADCTKHTVSNLKINALKNFYIKKPGLRDNFKIKEDKGFTENHSALPYGCQMYVDPKASSYSRVLFNSANKDNDIDNNKDEINLGESGEWQNRSYSQRICLQKNEEEDNKPIIVSNLNTLNWDERYEMAVQKLMRLPTIDEVLNNKSEFEKNGDYWIAVGTPKRKGWIQIGNLNHFYGKLHMTALCDFEFTEPIKQANIFSLKNNGVPDSSIGKTECSLYASKNNYPFNPNYNNPENPKGCFIQGSYVYYNNNESLDSCVNIHNSYCVVDENKNNSQADYCPGKEDNSTNISQDCYNWLWQNAGCNSSIVPPNLENVKDMTLKQIKDNAKDWHDKAAPEKCYGNGARYEGPICYAKNSLPYPSWGDTKDFDAPFKAYQIFMPHDDYDFQEIQNKNADPLPGYKNAPESVRCEIRYDNLEDAKTACNENPNCTSVGKDQGLCNGKLYELRSGELSNWDGMTTYQKVDKHCSKEFPYRTNLNEHEILDNKYCYDRKVCTRNSTRNNYDNNPGTYCSKATWKVLKIPDKFQGDAKFAKTPRKEYCGPYPGDASCNSSGKNDKCFPANSLDECKDQCIDNCAGISYDESRKYCILCENTNQLISHNSWDTYKNKNFNKKKTKTWTRPGLLYDSGWFKLKAQNGEDSFIEKKHGLLDFAIQSNPTKRIPDLCRVYIRIPEGKGFKNEGMIFEAGGLSAADDDQSKYGGLLFAYNEENVRIWAPTKYNNTDTGAILMTEDGWGNGDLGESVFEAEVRIVAY